MGDPAARVVGRAHLVGVAVVSVRPEPAADRPRWLVLAVGDLAPRIAFNEPQARRWAQNLGGAILTHPDGREENVPGAPTDPTSHAPVTS